MPPTPPPAIAAAGMSRGFGDVQVLKELHVTVGAGERVALVGGNGSGKTTLLRIVASTLQPDAGQVHVGGDVAGTTQAKGRTGVCFALERSFFEPLTATQNLMIFARMRLGRREANRAVGQILEELELGWLADRPVAGFSAGMRGQLGLGRALLADPEVLLLDEPTRSFDEAAVGRLWAALERRPQAIGNLPEGPAMGATPTKGMPTVPNKAKAARITARFDASRRSTRIVRLAISRLKVPATVTLRCTGRGCRFSTRHVTANASTLDLTERLRTVRLEPGARLRVTVRSPRTRSADQRFTMRTGRAPRQDTMMSTTG